MISTVRKLLELERMLALRAAKHVEVCPDLPVDLLPGYAISLSDKGNELL